MFRDKVKTIEPANADFVNKMALDGKEWRQCVRTIYDYLYVFTENDCTLKICMQSFKVTLMAKSSKSRFYFAA